MKTGTENLNHRQNPLSYYFNSRDYHSYWQEYGVYFIRSSGVLY